MLLAQLTRDQQMGIVYLAMFLVILGLATAAYVVSKRRTK